MTLAYAVRSMWTRRSISSGSNYGQEFVSWHTSMARHFHDAIPSPPSRQKWDVVRVFSRTS